MEDGKRSIEFPATFEFLNDDSFKRFQKLVKPIPKGEETISVKVTLPSGEEKIFTNCAFIVSKDKKSLEWFNDEGYGMVIL